MSLLRRLLIITFIESFATILMERALYFYTGDVLGMDETTNLWLALILGVTYVVGALSSHKLCKFSNEKEVLWVCVLGQTLTHLALFIAPSRYLVMLSMGLVGLFNGIKWPIVESYISAGQLPRQAAKTVGSFNIAWSAAVPLSLFVAGPLITFWPPGIFLVATLVNVVTLWLMRPLQKHPIHLADDHPERLPPDTLGRYRSLLISSRWTLLCSYTLLFLMAPLLPGLFRKFGVTVMVATSLSALMDIMRVLSFLLLRHFHQWHGKVLPALLVVFAVPIGFVMVLFGNHLICLLLGELLFGLAAGVCYYGALYYAMVVSNASVDAGGNHEGLIGLGFSVGPAVGLGGKALAGPLGGATAGMAVGVAPVVLLCIPMGLRPLWGIRS